MLKLFPCIVAALMLLTLAPAQTQAQQAAASTSLARCSEKLVPYSEWSNVKTPVFSLDLASPAKGRLYYFGAEHSSDPSNPQFAEIEKSWNAVKPTVAFYEGPNRPIAATREETIKQAGESGFVRFLAARDGVPLMSLEPSPQDEVKYILKKFSLEQTALFFILREAARLRERRKMSEPEIRAAITQLLARAAQAKILESPFTNLDEVEAAYKRHWKNPSEWWQAPMAWFDPLKSSAETGGIFTNDINQMSSGYRNVNMYTVLSTAALEGKKVFAVVGRNHVPMQAEALRCALK
jgi:hypothetical protein